MIAYGGAIFLVVGFIFILKIFGLLERSTRVIDISKQAMLELRNSEMTDDDKESAMQGHAKQLVGLFFLIAIGSMLAVFLPLGMIWALDRLGLVSIDDVLSVALSWPFIIATTVLLSLAFVFSRKR